MKKLKLQLDDLVVDSFVTSEGGPAAGTVLAQGSGVASENECTCAVTCDVTCPNTCPPGCESNAWNCPVSANPCTPTELGVCTIGAECPETDGCGGATDGFDSYCGDTCMVQCGTY